MADFTRACACGSCGREYVVSGTSANPANETQVAMDFNCLCGGVIPAYVPGSANRDGVRIAPRREE
jgi:hypothetical protein